MLNNSKCYNLPLKKSNFFFKYCVIHQLIISIRHCLPFRNPRGGTKFYKNVTVQYFLPFYYLVICRALLATIRELRRANCALTQRLKRLHRPPVYCRGSKSLYTGCRISPSFISNIGRTTPLSSSYSRVGKVSII